MGMTIEERFKILQDEYTHLMGKYQMMQADYNARLKADMVAMLEELDLELYEQHDDADLVKVKYIRQSIQEKIDKLKGGNEDQKETEFHCGIEESGGHAYNCNDCPNKCEEWYQWDNEFKEAKNDKS